MPTLLEILKSHKALCALNSQIATARQAERAKAI
jgi:hypothetical protein